MIHWSPPLYLCFTCLTWVQYTSATLMALFFVLSPSKQPSSINTILQLLIVLLCTIFIYFLQTAMSSLLLLLLLLLMQPSSQATLRQDCCLLRWGTGKYLIVGPITVAILLHAPFCDILSKNMNQIEFWVDLSLWLHHGHVVCVSVTAPPIHHTKHS
jgi:hypothetical protein